MQAKTGSARWAASGLGFHLSAVPLGSDPVGFYLVLASAFGFMLHVRKCDKQKYSEACRPLLGRRVDGFKGKLIDLLAVFALLCRNCYYSFPWQRHCSPWPSIRIPHPASNLLTIGPVAIIGITYTIAVYFGMKACQNWLLPARTCSFALLLYVLIGGGKARYTIGDRHHRHRQPDPGILSVCCTWTDALRTLLLSTDLDYFLLGLLDGGGA